MLLRLDKMLAHLGYGSRKDVKRIIRKGEVLVNGKVAKGKTVVKEGDVIEITSGSNTNRFEVLNVSEHATKESAALMFKQL